MNTNAAPSAWNERRFYFYSLFAPIGLPLALFILHTLVEILLGSMYGTLFEIGTLIVLSGIFGGVPYAIIAGIGGFVLRKHSLIIYKGWIVTLPLQLAAFFYVTSFFMSRVDQAIFETFALFSLGFGYAYVVPTFAFGWWLKRRHVKKFSASA